MKWRIVLVVGIIVVGLVWWATGSKSTDEVVKIEDEKLQSLYQATQQVEYFQAKKITDDDTADYFEVWVQRPDKTQTKVGTGSSRLEFIHIDKDTYISKTEEETWYRLTVPRRDEVKVMTDRAMQAITEALEDYPEDFRFVGESACGDMVCYVYEYDYLFLGTIRFGFDTEHSLIRWTDFSGEGIDSIGIEMTYEEIEIVAPEEVNELVIPDNPTEEDMKLIDYIYGQEE